MWAALHSWQRSQLCKLLAVLVAAALLAQCAFSLLEPRGLEPLFTISSLPLRRPGPGAAGAYRARTHAPPRGLLFSASDGLPAADATATGATPAAAPDLASLSVDGANSSAAANLSALPICPVLPPNLEGPLKVSRESAPLASLQEGRGPAWLRALSAGGHFRPSGCRARHRVAVVVPYRDRAAHLALLLTNLHPLLQKQQLDYRIVVVEQAGNGAFNRAMLMNIGFVEALKLYDFQCFIFHDVDLLPEDDRNLYTCPEQPRHMSVAIDVFKYRLPYADIFGGVSAMTREQFQKVNGFSNMFWGWGGEDDDMSNRIRFHGYHISRYPANIARYKMLTHRKQRANPKRYEFLNTGRRRFRTDGLNSLHYDCERTLLYRSHTQLLVRLPSPTAPS
ncbi:beta-1,4-N-acetylgalactosaminyltransferase bre-4-like [Schistocerca gregaria]|uniref:beta-1,4-N-acetylgalactosaminyltransferase bre-4-like n=1 Tax=Schistocerca gregaria TaxID=7010 RepID=UPI00211E979E|nr:beta-1,4-N-acetylgalactosaminyltransferase bre-4-like [Schistocerca gregaria]XP_049853658.1 beta-1,4-N-acetylgalactosaminyltransferase bre-4-like [Schistocerca gregaria]